MKWEVWTKYVPTYKWDEQRGLLIVMESGEELTPEEVDPGYHYYRRREQEIWSDGKRYETRVDGSELVKVRPIYYMVAPYHEGTYDFDTVERPIGFAGWYARLRLGKELGARPAIWVVQEIYDYEYYWLTITEYPQGRVIVQHELAPKDIELFAKVCPNPRLEDWPKDEKGQE